MGGGSNLLPTTDYRLLIAGQVQVSAADRGSPPASVGGASNRKEEMASCVAWGHARGCAKGMHVPRHHDFGHFGVTKTLQCLFQALYWERLRCGVNDFCRHCDLCIARKGQQGQSRAQLQQFPVGELMQWVGVDIRGPFLCTTQRKGFVLTTTDYFMKCP